MFASILVSSVAPFAGAWIETPIYAAGGCVLGVSPPSRGAWIETLDAKLNCCCLGAGCPLRGGRGSKQYLLGAATLGGFPVAPFAAAWIETFPLIGLYRTLRC